MNVFVKPCRKFCPKEPLPPSEEQLKAPPNPIKGSFNGRYKTLPLPLKRLASALKQSALPFLALCGMAVIIALPNAAMQGVKRGVTLWFSAVLPAVFPFFFLSLLLAQSEALPRAERLLAPVCHTLFSLPARVGIILLSALLSGYPVGAKLIESAVLSGAITREEGRKASAFCITSGPLFLLGTVGMRLFQSATVGRILLLSHLLSALIVGVAVGKIRPTARPKTQAVNLKTQATSPDCNPPSPPSSNKKSDPVYEATLSMLTVCGVITLLSVFLDVICEMGVLRVLSAPLSLLFGDEALSRGAALGAVEVTRGCSELAALGVFPKSVALCAALLSFGGVSVFLQSAAFLSRAGIKIKTCILGKGMQAAISYFIALLLAKTAGI